jgi:serine O-acetyltransferase
MKDRLRKFWKRLNDWTRERPAPEMNEGPDRVKLTPPSEQSSGAFPLLRTMVEDVDAVLEHDPAARSAFEVLIAYPGLHSLWMHRVAHGMWRRGMVLTPRALSHANRFITGIEIHPGARIGRRVFIDHGMGIVVGETATIGDDCLLYKGVVLGGTSVQRKERHPTLGKKVVVGTNACILGAIQIGDGARVGSGSVVIHDVPEGATVVGVPGRVSATSMGSARQQLNHADLPDPVANVFEQLVEEIESLKREVSRLKGDEPGKLAGRRSEHDDFSDEIDSTKSDSAE